MSVGLADGPDTKPSDASMIGGIEAGGNKFVLAVGPSPARITAQHTIPTTDPSQTLAEAADWFESHGTLAALGVASFGPLVLDRASADWGRIASTPKPGWSNCDIAGYFANRLNTKVDLDTDVNVAAIAEWSERYAQGISSLCYVTVGTGIGGGAVLNGTSVKGAAHPEMGHIQVRRHPADGTFGGVCPYHGDCLEGLASGPAIAARWKSSLSDLPADHEAHDIVAFYLAQLAHGLFSILSSEVVVFGGGVMKTRGLHDRIRSQAMEFNSCYLPASDRLRIEAPRLPDRAGIVGAMMLGAAMATG